MGKNVVNSSVLGLWIIAILTLGTAIACGNSSGPQVTGGIRVLFIGNSLTAAYQLSPEQGFASIRATR